MGITFDKRGFISGNFNGMHVNLKVLIWIRIKALMQFLSFIRKLSVVGEVVMYLYSIISISHHDHLVMSNTFDLKDEHFIHTILPLLLEST